MAKKKDTSVTPLPYQIAQAANSAQKSIDEAKTKKPQKKAVKSSPLADNELTNTRIKFYQEQYQKAKEAGNYAGMRTANEGANKVRRFVGSPQVNSFAGDTQWKASRIQEQKENRIVSAPISVAKNAYQALQERMAEQGKLTTKLSFDDNPYHYMLENHGNPVYTSQSPITMPPLTDAQKRAGVNVIKRQYEEHPFLTGLKDDLINKNTIVPRILREQMGNPYALSILDADQSDMEQVAKSQDHFAYKAGNFVGEAAQYMAPYAGFSKAFKAGTVGGNAVLKATPKVSAVLKKALPKVNPATLEKVAEALVRNAAMDLTVGASMDTYKGYDDGLRGNELAENIAKNAVLNLGLGGVMEAAPYAFRGAKNAITAPRMPVINPATGKASMVRNSVLETANGVVDDSMFRAKVNSPAPIGKVNNTAEAMNSARKTMKMSLKDFSDPSSPVWNNIDIDNDVAKRMVTYQVHRDMVANGDILRIDNDALEAFKDYFPDLRHMKKRDRLPIQKQKIKEIKTVLRTMLETDFKGKATEFEVNGNLIDAILYDTGIREVLDKINQPKAAVIKSTREIFSKAKYLYSTTDKSGNPNIYRWNYFYVPLKLGENADDIIGIRIAIRDMKKANESQIYNFGIKKGTTLPAGPGGQSPSLSNGQFVPSNQTIAQPAPVVKDLGSDVNHFLPKYKVSKVRTNTIENSPIFRKAKKHMSEEAETQEKYKKVEGKVSDKEFYRASKAMSGKDTDISKYMALSKANIENADVICDAYGISKKTRKKAHSLMDAGVTEDQYQMAYEAQKGKSTNVAKARALFVNREAHAEMYEAFNLSEKDMAKAIILEKSNVSDADYTKAHDFIKKRFSDREDELRAQFPNGKFPSGFTKAAKKYLIDSQFPNYAEKQRLALYAAFDVVKI